MPALTTKSQEKVDLAKKSFDKLGLIYEEKANGQLQVDKANYWSTTQKWYNPVTGEKGTGLNAFIKMLKDNNII